MKSLKKGDFYVVPRFTWDNLSMESGALRDIYSIIYNISQDGDSSCKCTVQYFMDLTRQSERTVRSIIKQLVEAGYVTRVRVGSGPGSYVEYRANLEIVEKCRMGANFAPIGMGAKSSENGCKTPQKWVQNLPPNNNNIIIINNIFLPRVRAKEVAEKEEEILYNLFYWKNAQAPKKEVQNCLANWALSDRQAYGHTLDTQEKILRWADGWELKTGTKRVEPSFLASLNNIYGQLYKCGEEALAAMLVKESIRVVEKADGTIGMVLPAAFLDWFNNTMLPAVKEGNAPAEWSFITASMKAYARGRYINFYALKEQ